ncbi:MAG: Cna B domain-containing protein, partial [Acidobacteriaceae bacterium]|nr:Cna B domain-containing protein [Acidobacteriaceae bacterium]
DRTGQVTTLSNPSCWFYVAANPSCVALDPQATSAFAVPAQYTYGNSGRNILRGDALVQFDFTAMKQFRFTESRILEFRGEFFNIFNTPTFALPSASIDVASGGSVSSTLNGARTIELALKLFF